jgi:hypothetical protein
MMKKLLTISGLCSCFVLVIITANAQQSATGNTKPVKIELPLKIAAPDISEPNGIKATRFEGPKLSQLPVLPAEDNTKNLTPSIAIPLGSSVQQKTELKNIDRPKTSTLRPMVISDPTLMPMPIVNQPTIPAVTNKQAQ